MKIEKKHLTFDFNDGNGPVPAHQHQNGGGWVAETAHVEDTARVSGNAQVFGNAQVYGDAGDALVLDTARVSGNAQVSGNASIQPVFINGLAWPITILDTEMQIACERHTFDEWKKFKNRRISKMDTRALEWWKIHKAPIMAMVKAARLN